MLRTYATALAVAAALFLAGSAGAEQPTVVDQYTEQVPTPGGEKPVKETPSATDSGGSDGTVAAAGAPSGGSGGTGGQASAPNESSGPGKVDQSAGGRSTEGSVASPDTSTGGTTAQESDSDGMGLLFPLILVGCLVVVAAIFIGRRRAGAGPQAT